MWSLGASGMEKYARFLVVTRKRPRTRFRTRREITTESECRAISSPALDEKTFVAMVWSCRMYNKKGGRILTRSCETCRQDTCFTLVSGFDGSKVMRVPNRW